MSLAVKTRNFWCASVFFRRAPSRDQRLAERVLEQVATSTTGALQRRAASLLTEIDRHEHPHRPTAG